MKYEVKLEVVETHYLTIDADSKKDAEDIVSILGTHSADAHITDVEIISTTEVKP